MSVTRGDLGMLFGLAGLLLAGAACYHAIRAWGSIEGENGIRSALKANSVDTQVLTEQATGAVADVEKLREDLAASNVRISALQKELDATTQRLNGIETRLGLLEAK
ncbi:MAG: hypothetical protein HMLKMBBP_03585 [Planctomycetes bacterium]|nr:hypothetical protein [Planctomycetota bacterium]